MNLILVDEICQELHLPGRTRININTARNWLKALNIKWDYFLCADGKRRIALTEDKAYAFKKAYKAKLAFKVSKAREI